MLQEDVGATIEKNKERLNSLKAADQASAPVFVRIECLVEPDPDRVGNV